MTMSSAKACSVECCEKPQLARGWCRMHYSRWWKHGDPHVVLKAPGPELKPKVGYYAMHYRVYAAKGKANQHICPCGKRASEWSYDHTDPDELVDGPWPYSLDPANYSAMCTPCHRRLDWRKLTPEQGALV